MKRFLLTAAALAVSIPAFGQQVTQPAPISGGLSLNGARLGRAFATLLTAAPAAAALGAANRMYATPVYLAAPATLASLSFNITVGNASAWNARMCLYSDNAGVPGSLVVDSGAVAIASGSVTGVQTVTSLNTALAQGWYWAAFLADNNSETLSVAGSSGAIALAQTLIGASSVADFFAGTTTSGVYAAQSFGACPATFPTVTYNRGASTPLVVLGF